MRVVTNWVIREPKTTINRVSTRKTGRSASRRVELQYGCLHSFQYICQLSKTDEMTAAASELKRMQMYLLLYGNNEPRNSTKPSFRHCSLLQMNQSNIREYLSIHIRTDSEFFLPSTSYQHADTSSVNLLHNVSKNVDEPFSILPETVWRTYI